MKYEAMATHHDDEYHSYTCDHFESDDLEELKKQCQEDYSWSQYDVDHKIDTTYWIYEKTGLDICETKPFKYDKELVWIAMT